MVDRVEERFQLTPERLIGDTAYGSAPMLAWMVEDKGIEPHVPLWDRTQRNDNTLSSGEFQWDEQADEYRCPQGHALLSDRRQFTKPRDRITKAGTILQLCVYTDMLGRLQGLTPEHMHVVKPGGDFEPETFRFAEFHA